MKKLLSILTFSAIFNISSFPQAYQFDSIPQKLRNGADAVIRKAECLYSVSAPGKAVQKIKKAITLLNEDADSYRYLAVFYDKYTKIDYIRGNVYDEKGMIVRAMGASDILDMSAITGGTFYSDDRMRVMRFPMYKYPYTIEYEYQVTLSSLMTYPMWNFQEERNVSVEKSGIQFVFPAWMKFRYSEQSLKNRVDSIVLGDRKIYTWQENNLPAMSLLRSLSMSSFSEPVLDAAPYDFEYAGLSGSMRNWSDFGKWVYMLNKGRDILPEEEISAIKSLASKYPDIRDKIKAVYEYMQSKTRYVSVQIGVGGYQTAEASAVSTNGFGDCKALVNYTMALLKAAGIDSYYTLVRAGADEQDIKTSFVDNQFNHAILCVPTQKDTVWLECTSQTLPYNYLGSFTGDRHALMITPEGGKLVRTQSFAREKNLVQRSGSLFFNTSGTSSARLSVRYSGYHFGNNSMIFGLQSEDEMKRTLYSSLSYPDFSVASAKYTENKSGEPYGEFQYQVNIKSFGATNGKQIFFTPSLTKEDFLPSDTIALRIKVSDITVDSISYWLPEGYRVEALPESMNLENEFGKYTFNIQILGDKIILYRRLELQKGLIPSSVYRRFRDFYNIIARTDRSIVVLAKRIT